MLITDTKKVKEFGLMSGTKTKSIMRMLNGYKNVKQTVFKTS